jgi:ADP-heptose:LPS heptosyltransferase
MEFYLPPKKNIDIQKFISKLKPSILIGFNTEGSSKLHTLDEHQIIAVCKGLDKNNIKTILFSLPDKRQYFQRLIDDNNLHNTILSYKTKSIYDAAEIMTKIDLMISPDTSFVHIASGLNIPIVALLKNSFPQAVIWGPKSKLNIVVTPHNDKEEAIRAIKPESIVEATFNLLSKVLQK